jgi:hypothetical protein
MQWFGKPVNFNRFLGQVDQDDPTNLPIGLAALCRNTDFTRESPGVTCASTRAGNNLAIQLVGTDGQPSKDPATGGIFFVYEPELATDAALFPPAGYFQMPFFFEGSGALQREWPVGTGRCKKLPASPLFTPPANSHMLGCAADNKVWAAFTDLFTPTSYGVCIDPKAIATNGPLAVNPIGMKPVGWYWTAKTDVIVGEYCCPPAPTTGNGHTYRCIQAGTTGAVAPAFPLTEATQFNDGTVKWQEATMVLANRLPPPAAPAVVRDPGSGAFGAGLDVYVLLTLINAQGETTPGLPSVLVNTNAADAVSTTILALAAMAGWIQTLGAPYVPTAVDVYVATVTTGNPAPPISSYELFLAGAALNSTVIVTGPGTGAAPPSATTARVVPGQLPTPDVLPNVARSPAGGAFPAGQDVYVIQTYTNAVGETKASPAALIANTVLNDGVQVTVAVPEDDNSVALYTIASVGLYEADVPTGTPAPPSSSFGLVGYYAAGATPVIMATAAGVNPPTSNTTGPGGAIVADTTTGGPNGGQGYRYAACLFMNQNETVSGFTVASAIGYDVDEDGWEIGAFNILTGPSNIVARLLPFTSADSSQDGPFNWLGLINLLAPSVDVVYPMTTPVDNVDQSATAILDNVTTQAVFNFTDTYLDSGNNVDDRTDILPPFKACRIDYLKTINCLAYSGVLGYTGGGLIAIEGDPESVYADTGPVPFPADGERCFGFSDAYKSVIFGFRESGGYAIQPNTGNPSGWDVVQRWSDYGPCGFRAWAANGKFIVFVHRSGVYKYDESDPDLMSKEIPRKWSTINWAAAAGIQVTIDEDTHTVRIQVPTGQSTVNNEEFCLSYLEGWQNPIHFSTYSGKEISMDAARRWSFNDVAANLCVRMNRTLPPGAAFIDGPDWTTQPDSSFGISQLLYLDSAPDGGVQARTPGVYSDNAAGIDWQWESVCAGMMQAVCKPEGVNLNVLGHGLIYWSFLAARDQDAGPGGPRENEIQIGDGYFELDSGQRIGITGKCEPQINEFWRVRFTNAKEPGAWASLKQMTVYLIPFTVGRGSWETNK